MPELNVSGNFKALPMTMPKMSEIRIALRLNQVCSSTAAKAKATDIRMPLEWADTADLVKCLIVSKCLYIQVFLLRDCIHW